MRAVRVYTGQKPTWSVVGAVGLTACLALAGCGGGSAGEATSESSPQVTVTVTQEPTPSVEPEETPEATPESTMPPIAITEAELSQLLLTMDDLTRAGKFPKGPFDEEVQFELGAQSYTTYDSIRPAECAGLVQGPFAGTSADPNGPIIGSAMAIFFEGEVASVPGKPVAIIQTIQVFSSDDEAADAFAVIVDAAPNCRSYSYDDGGGVIERDWMQVFSTLGGDNPAYKDTVTMFDATTLRVIGLIDDRIWALSLNSSRATEAAELDRFRDLIVQLKPRLQD